MQPRILEEPAPPGPRAPPHRRRPTSSWTIVLRISAHCQALVSTAGIPPSSCSRYFRPWRTPTAQTPHAGVTPSCAPWIRHGGPAAEHPSLPRPRFWVCVNTTHAHGPLSLGFKPSTVRTCPRRRAPPRRSAPCRGEPRPSPEPPPCCHQCVTHAVWIIPSQTAARITPWNTVWAFPGESPPRQRSAVARRRVSAAARTPKSSDPSDPVLTR